jgi:hypothetical protein
MATVSTVQAENLPATCVIPIYSTMDASGTASIETLIQSTVSMGYDISFGIVLDEAAAAKIANGFAVAGGADSFAVDMAAAGAADFKAALKAAIEAATNAAATPLTLQKVLYNDALATLKDVWSDLLANVLESDWQLNVAVGYEAGAANMHTDLDGAAPAVRRAIASQLPESNFALYMDASENPTTAALPLKKGDTIVFLFDVTTALISRGNSKVNSSAVSNAPDSGAAGFPATGNVADVAGTAYTQAFGTGLVQQYSGRKDVVAFFLTVGNTAAANGKIAGLSAAPAAPPNLIASGSGPAQGY